MKPGSRKLTRFFLRNPRALATVVHSTGKPYWCPFPVGDERKRAFDAEWQALELEDEVYKPEASAGRY